MKLFAYEHPSGPVHEVEVTLGDTARWRRLFYSTSAGCCSPHAPPPRRWGTRGAAGPSPGRDDDAARARSRLLSRISDGAAPRAPAATTAKQTRAGPPTQVQDRAGHADFGAGITCRRRDVVPVTASRWRGGSRRSTTFNSRREPHTGPRKSSKRKNNTSPSAARSSTTTPRRSRRSGSRRTTRCARSPSR